QDALTPHPDRPLHRDPGHEPRVGEALPTAPRLPEALVGLVPGLANPLDDLSELLPGLVGDGLAVLVVQVDGIDQLAVDVELELVGRAVADAHRCRSAVALEVVELDLLEVGAAVDAVHDLER